MRSFTNIYLPHPSRRGLSFVEFTGCLVAMVGGVFLGSTYLGIDMKDMAVGVLAKAEVVSPEFFKSDNDGTTQPVSTDATQIDSQDSNSVSVGKSEIDAAQIGTQKESDRSGVDTQIKKPEYASEPTAAERRAATRAYWNALTQCMLVEARNRSQGFQPAEELQLYDYLASRKNGHSEALEALGQLEEFGVDERLLSHGRQVVTWNSSAVRLFDRALALLTDGPAAGISGPFAQSWQSSATQLRMEESLILDKHAAVASYLDHEYADLAPFAPAYKK